ELGTAQQRAESINGTSIEIAAKAGSEGKLFGSVGTVDIAEACEAKGVSVERREVRLPDGPLRVVGEHEVEIHLHTDVNAMIKVNVIAEEE
ncbi:MAG: 50S ribosomal protein L9, partial [Pseudomonadota bacterium]